MNLIWYDNINQIINNLNSPIVFFSTKYLIKNFLDYFKWYYKNKEKKILKNTNNTYSVNKFNF